jgi:RsiW-degrading membrane proteinase PrsW (M82 family)
MHSVSASFSQNPLAFILALLAGTVPAILWLIFWRREDDTGHRDPTGLLVLTFVAGMLSVVFVLPIEKFLSSVSTDQKVLITLWAASEELFKYMAFAMIMHKSRFLDKPVEYPIYLMAAGLGFAALENTLYLIHPVAVNDATVSFLTGNLRFLGSTLLHSVTSGIIGISIGLAFFRSEAGRTFNLFFGIAAAIALHSVFNFFIMKNNGENFLQVFGFLWVVTIIIMLLFEKLRRMGAYVQQAEPQVA